METEFGDSTGSAQASGQVARRRWEDDGGRGGELLVFISERGLKPAWSVLSLRDLNRTIRMEKRPDNPRRLQEQAQRVNRERGRAAEVTQEKEDRAIRAKRERYGNAWEHPCQ
jgi:hypothetical protein